MDGCGSERSGKASRVDDLEQTARRWDAVEREGIAMPYMVIEGERGLSVRSLERAMTVVCKDENKGSMIRPSKPYRRAA